MDAKTFDKKRSFRQSSLTTIRFKEPSNPYMASRTQTSFFDFSKGMDLLPDSNKKSIMENTRGKNGAGRMIPVNRGANLTFSMSKSSGGDKNTGEVRGVVSYPGSKRQRPLSGNRKGA